jgi:hypothetical protein
MHHPPPRLCSGRVDAFVSFFDLTGFLISFEAASLSFASINEESMF